MNLDLNWNVAELSLQGPEKKLDHHLARVFDMFAHFGKDIGFPPAI